MNHRKYRWTEFYIECGQKYTDTVLLNKYSQESFVKRLEWVTATLE